MKLVQKIKIKNRLGLHIRPATIIVNMLKDTRSSVRFTYRQETVNAKSIMSILMLLARKNSCVTITVEGEDAQMTMQRLVDAFQSCFKEEP